MTKKKEIIEELKELFEKDKLTFSRRMSIFQTSNGSIKVGKDEFIVIQIGYYGFVAMNLNAKEIHGYFRA